MRRAIGLLATVLVVAAGVWYLVTRVPLAETGAPLAAAPPAPPAPPAPSQPRTSLPAGSPQPGAPPAPPLGPVCGAHCGVERWDVKTLSDADRGAVDLAPVDATVEQLAARPVEYPSPGHERSVPVELTVYRVEAYLTRVFTEDDHDWHLVLHGIQNPDASIIAEIPDPQCAGACRSGFADDYARARAMLEEHVAHMNLRAHPIRVRVTGAGFFDRIHGQAGVAPNGIELHPVLRIAFPR
jgi:hypothetical protein